MHIGHSQFGFDRESDYIHGKPDLKIGKTKSILYPTVRAWNSTMFCRIIPYALPTIFRLGFDGIFDAFLLRRQQLLEIITWLKSRSVLLRSYKQNSKLS